jgi:ribonuclease HII
MAGSKGASKPGRRPMVFKGVELRCSTRYEEEARAAGRVSVAGIDEVGRGALCGPVAAAAVVLGEAFDPSGLDDSKRLTSRQRETLAVRIRTEARAVCVAFAEVEEIDRLNILRATFLAMKRAVLGLGLRPDLVLVDALTVPGLECPQQGIVKGDAQCASIAAASIVAKVARDGIMRECDLRHPGYGLAQNMGYGSEDHLLALRRLGPSAIHRRSFSGTQPWLF